MNAIKLSGSLVLLLGVTAPLMLFSQAADAKKAPKLEKGSWRYEVEAVVTPADDLAVYRIRTWLAAEDNCDFFRSTQCKPV